MSATTPTTEKPGWLRRTWHYIDGRYSPDGQGRAVPVPGTSRTVDVRLLVPGSGVYLLAKAFTSTLFLLAPILLIAATVLMAAELEAAGSTLAVILGVDLLLLLLFGMLQSMLKPLRAVFVADVDRW